MFYIRFYAVLTRGWNGVHVLYALVFHFDTQFTLIICLQLFLSVLHVVYTELMLYMRCTPFDTWFTLRLCFTCVSLPFWHVVYTDFMFYSLFYSRFDTWLTRSLCFTCVSMLFWHVVFTEFMFYMCFYSDLTHGLHGFYVLQEFIFRFYAPGSNDRGHIVFVLSVCLSVCLFVCLSVVNFNIRYNFWTVRGRDFIFGMHTPLMMPFQMTTRSLTLWPWLWPLLKK